MTDNQNCNKRIAKNTLMLYFRMLLSMAIGFYTSRLVLSMLGVTDYGIYNVVGGIIGMLGFLNGTMASASSRYIVFYLGKGDINRLNTVFSTTVTIHLLIALLILILGETVGIWYLFNYFKVPIERFEASFWLYQLSIGSTLLTILNVPYNACIIAHERMSTYAYISLLDVFLKLLIAISLQWFASDRLIIYGVLIFLVQLIDFYIYRRYSKKNFEECLYKKCWDKSLIKEIMGFACWNLFGNLAFTSCNQGINLLLNLFFGPMINAARGIAVQVQGVISQFVWNFQTAINPQITKSYAEKNIVRMHDLIYSSSKYGFLLLYCIAIPIIIETPYLLNIWLTIVPDYTIVFLRIIMFISMIDALSNSLMISALATGHIMKYQLLVGGILLLVLPVSYIFLKLGAGAEIVFIVNLVFVMIALFARIYLLSSMIQLSVIQYFRKVLMRISLVAVFAIIFPMIIHNVMEESMLRVICVVLISICCTFFFTYFLGLTVEEKKIVSNKITLILKNKRPFRII